MNRVKLILFHVSSSFIYIPIVFTIKNPCLKFYPVLRETDFFSGSVNVLIQEGVIILDLGSLLYLTLSKVYLLSFLIFRGSQVFMNSINNFQVCQIFLSFRRRNSIFFGVFLKRIRLILFFCGFLVCENFNICLEKEIDEHWNFKEIIYVILISLRYFNYISRWRISRNELTMYVTCTLKSVSFIRYSLLFESNLSISRYF